MSIQDSSDVTYADHDVHHIRHRVINRPGSGGDNVSEDIAEEFEITERGLDPDELAELRAMRVQVGGYGQAQNPQDSRGVLAFGIDAGFNLGLSDALHLQGFSSTNFDPDGDGTDEIRSSVADTDEVGQIWGYADNFTIGFDDDTNGNGAGTTQNSVSEFISMSEMFGSGPYVDAADDFVSVISVEPDNIVENFGVEVNYSLYYDVNETEGGRSRFGR